VPAEVRHALPRDVSGMDVVELGCGTAYFGTWLARRGAPISAAYRRRLDSTKAEMSCLNSEFSISTSNSR
jgi:2-polyprenyl-3-methyl-5-hydroxy-6-metoxy-1,4-benzoquinol methylase